MKKSLLNKIKNIDNQKFKKGISAGLIALMVASTASNLTACNVNPFSSEEESSTYSETSLRFGEGRVFSNVKERKLRGKSLENITFDYIEKLYAEKSQMPLEFLGLPFEFLIEEGLCTEIAENEYDLYGGYRTRNDMGRISGGDANATIFTNQGESNKVYMLVQYTYGLNQYYDEQTNRNAGWVASYLLEYTVSEQDFYDLQVLLKGNDFRTRFFVQEMDKIYTPNVLSKSVYDFYSLWQLKPFVDLAGNTSRDVLCGGDLYAKYIESVDYDNKLIKVNYYDKEGKEGPGIYQYTINPVENEKWWNNIIEFLAERGETPELGFSSYPTIVGEACSFYSYTGLGFHPTDEMKNSAKKVYDFTNMRQASITTINSSSDLEDIAQQLKEEGLVQ